MNYDLCDLLNRKMEAQFKYFDENLSAKTIFKDQKFLNDYLEKYFPDDFLKLAESENFENQSIALWVYRNGKFSDQLLDFDNSAKKITREIANLTYSNNPSYDIMYFSGVMKIIFSKEKCMYLETCIKPTLDQLMTLKDFQKKILCNSDTVFWKIVDRKGRFKFYEGKSLDTLFSFNWSKVK